MIYQLRYTDKETAITDLKSVGVIDENGKNKGFPTHNVVFVGLIPDVYGTYDDEGNELTPITYKEGYHVDVMDDRDDLEFSGEISEPKTPYHKF